MADINWFHYLNLVKLYPSESFYNSKKYDLNVYLMIQEKETSKVEIINELLWKFFS